MILYLKEPKKIYTDEVGFDMRHSNQGSWGTGIYFAVNAQYSSSGFAFKNKDGTRSIFYARVAVGILLNFPVINHTRFLLKKNQLQDYSLLKDMIQ
jgi:hypothetical protein